jgi:molecular chaperone HscB
MFKVLDSAVPIACWSCSIGHNDSTLFCPHCSKIQPPPGGDYYSVFGLEPKLNLDMPALEREFHRLSRRLHPDRFARAGENEKQWSLADTALLNDAYRTLKDPLRRTGYLLKLLGARLDSDHESREQKDARVPADLLEEVFELNMLIEEMRAARNAGETDAALEANLAKAKKNISGMLGAVDEELRTEWNVWDAGDAGTRQFSQVKMVALLDRRRYLSNLVRDVNEVLGA